MKEAGGGRREKKKKPAVVWSGCREQDESLIGDAVEKDIKEMSRIERGWVKGLGSSRFSDRAALPRVAETFHLFSIWVENDEPWSNQAACHWDVWASKPIWGNVHRAARNAAAGINPHRRIKRVEINPDQPGRYAYHMSHITTERRSSRLGQRVAAQSGERCLHSASTSRNQTSVACETKEESQRRRFYISVEWCNRGVANAFK